MSAVPPRPGLALPCLYTLNLRCPGMWMQPLRSRPRGLCPKPVAATGPQSSRLPLPAAPPLPPAPQVAQGGLDLCAVHQGAGLHHELRGGVPDGGGAGGQGAAGGRGLRRWMGGRHRLQTWVSRWPAAQVTSGATGLGGSCSGGHPGSSIQTVARRPAPRWARWAGMSTAQRSHISLPAGQ